MSQYTQGSSVPGSGGGGGSGDTSREASLFTRASFASLSVVERNDRLLIAIRASAASFDHFAGAQFALRHGASPNATSEDGNSALHWACWSDFPHIVRMLVHAGADINRRNRDGQTPAMWAAIAGSVTCLSMLAEADNAQRCEAVAAAVDATRESHSRTVNALISAASASASAGALIGPAKPPTGAAGAHSSSLTLASHDSANVDAESAAAASAANVSIATAAGPEPSVVNALISPTVAVATAAARARSVGANPALPQPTTGGAGAAMSSSLTSFLDDDNAHDTSSGSSAGSGVGASVGVASSSGWLSAAFAWDSNASLADSRGSGSESFVTARCNSGFTCLHLATRYVKRAAVDFLLSLGSDIDARDARGRTPLHHALEFNHIPVAELLITRGADAAARDVDGNTPLHALTAAGDFRELATLLMRFYNFAPLAPLRNDAGETAADVARKMNYGKLASIISKRDPSRKGRLDLLYARVCTFTESGKDASMMWIGFWLFAWITLWLFHHIIFMFPVFQEQSVADAAAVAAADAATRAITAPGVSVTAANEAAVAAAAAAAAAVRASASSLPPVTTVLFWIGGFATIAAWLICHYADPGYMLPAPQLVRGIRVPVLDSNTNSHSNSNSNANPRAGNRAQHHNQALANPNSPVGDNSNSNNNGIKTRYALVADPVYLSLLAPPSPLPTTTGASSADGSSRCAHGLSACSASGSRSGGSNGFGALASGPPPLWPLPLRSLARALLRVPLLPPSAVGRLMALYRSGLVSSNELLPATAAAATAPAVADLSNGSVGAHNNGSAKAASLETVPLLPLQRVPASSLHSLSAAPVLLGSVSTSQCTSKGGKCKSGDGALPKTTRLSTPHPLALMMTAYCHSLSQDESSSLTATVTATGSTGEVKPPSAQGPPTGALALPATSPLALAAALTVTLLSHPARLRVLAVESPAKARAALAAAATVAAALRAVAASPAARKALCTPSNSNSVNTGNVKEMMGHKSAGGLPSGHTNDVETGSQSQLQSPSGSGSNAQYYDTAAVSAATSALEAALSVNTNGGADSLLVSVWRALRDPSLLPYHDDVTLSLSLCPGLTLCSTNNSNNNKRGSNSAAHGLLPRPIVSKLADPVGARTAGGGLTSGLFSGAPVNSFASRFTSLVFSASASAPAAAFGSNSAAANAHGFPSLLRTPHYPFASLLPRIWATPILPLAVPRQWAVFALALCPQSLALDNPARAFITGAAVSANSADADADIDSDSNFGLPSARRRAGIVARTAALAKERARVVSGWCEALWVGTARRLLQAAKRATGGAKRKDSAGEDESGAERVALAALSTVSGAMGGSNGKSAKCRGGDGDGGALMEDDTDCETTDVEVGAAASLSSSQSAANAAHSASAGSESAPSLGRSLRSQSQSSQSRSPVSPIPSAGTASVAESALASVFSTGDVTTDRLLHSLMAAILSAGSAPADREQQDLDDDRESADREQQQQQQSGHVQWGTACRSSLPLRGSWLTQPQPLSHRQEGFLPPLAPFSLAGSAIGPWASGDSSRAHANNSDDEDDNDSYGGDDDYDDDNSYGDDNGDADIEFKNGQVITQQSRRAHAASLAAAARLRARRHCPGPVASAALAALAVPADTAAVLVLLTELERALTHLLTPLTTAALAPTHNSSGAALAAPNLSVAPLRPARALRAFLCPAFTVGSQWLPSHPYLAPVAKLHRVRNAASVRILGAGMAGPLPLLPFTRRTRVATIAAEVNTGADAPLTAPTVTATATVTAATGAVLTGGAAGVPVLTVADSLRPAALEGDAVEPPPPTGPASSLWALLVAAVADASHRAVARTRAAVLPRFAAAPAPSATVAPAAGAALWAGSASQARLDASAVALRSLTAALALTVTTRVAVQCGGALTTPLPPALAAAVAATAEADAAGASASPSAANTPASASASGSAPSAVAVAAAVGAASVGLPGTVAAAFAAVSSDSTVAHAPRGVALGWGDRGATAAAVRTTLLTVAAAVREQRRRAAAAVGVRWSRRHNGEAEAGALAGDWETPVRLQINRKASKPVKTGNDNDNDENSDDDSDDDGGFESDQEADAFTALSPSSACPSAAATRVGAGLGTLSASQYQSNADADADAHSGSGFGAAASISAAHAATSPVAAADAPRQRWLDTLNDALREMAVGISAPARSVAAATALGVVFTAANTSGRTHGESEVVDAVNVISTHAYNGGAQNNANTKDGYAQLSVTDKSGSASGGDAGGDDDDGECEQLFDDNATHSYMSGDPFHPASWYNPNNDNTNANSNNNTHSATSALLHSHSQLHSQSQRSYVPFVLAPPTLAPELSPLASPWEAASRFLALQSLGVHHPNLVCLTCRVAKPARAKHCRRCDRCVYRHDHHCPWVDTCVGAHNYRAFMSFVTLGTVLSWAYVFLAVMYVLTTGLLGSGGMQRTPLKPPRVLPLALGSALSASAASSGASAGMTTQALADAVELAVTAIVAATPGTLAHPPRWAVMWGWSGAVTLCSLAHAVFMALFVTVLWVSHLYLISGNNTTQEQIAPASYLHHYDKGFWRNWWAFFKGPATEPLLFPMPVLSRPVRMLLDGAVPPRSANANSKNKASAKSSRRQSARTSAGAGVSTPLATAGEFSDDDSADAPSPVAVRLDPAVRVPGLYTPHQGAAAGVVAPLQPYGAVNTPHTPHVMSYEQLAVMQRNNNARAQQAAAAYNTNPNAGVSNLSANANANAGALGHNMTPGAMSFAERYLAMGGTVEGLREATNANNANNINSTNHTANRSAGMVSAAPATVPVGGAATVGLAPSEMDRGGLTRMPGPALGPGGAMPVFAPLGQIVGLNNNVNPKNSAQQK